MCFGGSDDNDSNNNDIDDRKEVRSFDRMKNVTLRDYEKRGVNQTDPIQSDNPGRDFETGRAYAENQAKLAGYGQNNKGVVDKEGNAVLDGFGNPVQSGTYSDIMDNSESDHSRSMAYNTARVEAEKQYNTALAGATESVSPALIAAGLGTNDLALKDGYNLTDAVFGTSKATAKQRDEYTKMLAQAMRENYLGTNVRRFPGATFDDPLGTALASTLDGTYLGSDMSAAKQRENFSRLASAYNKGPFRSKLEVDAAGNIGTTTLAQRFGGGLANLIEGLALGAVAGPVGSAFGIGTDYKVMNNYGTPVDGFGTGTTGTASFDLKNMAGGFVGDQLASQAAPAVGKALYKQTGDLTASMAGAVGSGIIAAEQGGKAVGGYLSDNFGLTPNIMSSDISPPYKTPKKDRVDSGFGASLADGEGNASVATVAPAVAPAMSTLQNTGLSDSATDLAASDPNFDWQAWLAANAKRANPNTGQPVDLSGASTVSASNNPLFSAAPDLNGVRMLTQRTNRDYGSAMVEPLNSLQRYNSNRRGNLDDKRVGVVIG